MPCLNPLIRELDTPVQYVIVSEAGASVYSASKLATELKYIPIKRLMPCLNPHLPYLRSPRPRRLMPRPAFSGSYTRAQLLKVPKLGPKAYEQCAGFLRILDGENPLDATSVHPESYQAAMQLLDKMGLTMEDVRKAQKAAAVKKSCQALGLSCQEHHCGE